MKNQKQYSFQEIEEHYRELIKKEPENAEAFHVIGVCAVQRGDLVDGYEFMQKAEAMSLNTQEFYNNFGNLYNKLHKKDEAIRCYKKALELDPEYILAYNNMGNIYLKQGNLAQARTNFEIAIKIMPNYLDARYNLTTVLLKQNLTSEALQQLDILLEINPQHAKAHHRKAQTLYQLDNLSSAIYHYQKYLELKPNDTDALHNLGTIFLRLGEPQKAIKYFLRIIPLSSDSENFYNLGVAYMQQNWHKEAIMYFEQTLNLNPDNIDALTNIAAVYLKLEDYQGAAKYFHEILRLKPNDPEATFMLSAISKANKEFETAPNLYIQNLFDSYAPNYEQHLSLLEYTIPDLILNILSENSKSKNNWNILDLGCGTGLIGEKLRPLAQKLIGIDLSEKMLAVAKQKNIYDELISGDINETINQYSELDLIVAAETLVYTGNLDKIFAQSNAALKSNGLFVFTIEKTAKYPYELQKSARFAHAKKYIEKLNKKYNFKILSNQNVNLRKHHNEKLEGHIYVLKKI
jgi:predicted TPR repeat methyltransferase